MTGGPEEGGYWKQRYGELEETLAHSFEAFAKTLEAQAGAEPSAAPSPAAEAPLPPAEEPVADGADHVIPSGPAEHLDVTVVIPCYHSHAFLAGCIATLAAQTLSKDRFEAIFVFNGPDDGAYELAGSLLAGSGIHHQLARSSRGISPARNVGATLARAPWLTLLDVDDALTPNYLEAMLASATSPGVVPIAGIVDVDPAGVETSSTINDRIMEHEGLVEPAVLFRPLAISTLKMIPTDVVRRHPFDVTIRSGEDVALWADMFEAEDLVFDTTPAFRGAQYRRLVRRNSNGRQGMTRDFMITQRLDVIAELARQNQGQGKLAGVRRTFMNNQATFIARYLRAHPHELGEVYAEIEERGIDEFPWAQIPTDQLIVAYNFAPFNDASAVTAMKRLREFGGRWNVISKDMTGARTHDDSLRLLTRQLLNQQTMLEGPSAWSSWPATEEFCERGWEALQEIERGFAHRRLYSRAMWPTSHFLAALIKARRGDAIDWVAEFSDPLRTDVKGQPRPGVVTETALLDEFRAALASRGLPVPQTDSLFAWAETLAYGLADQVLFTNPHQFTHMLSEITEPALRERVLERAVISPHPTLPREFYELGPAPTELSPAQRHIAFFGTFYPTRGLGDIFDGLNLLTADQAARLKLHLFVPPSDALTEALAGLKHRASVAVYAQVPFLSFLSLSTHYDALLVNDASTRGMGKRVNPYLPSKLSDYRGSGRPIWAHVEPGSMLSREPAALRSRLGDPRSVARALTALSAQVTS